MVLIVKTGSNFAFHLCQVFFLLINYIPGYCVYSLYCNFNVQYLTTERNSLSSCFHLMCPCTLKTWQNKVHYKNMFPKCTDILLQCLVFFFLNHITRWLILYILFKQKFALPCAIQLECYFNLQFLFPFFVYLIKPNAARIYINVKSCHVGGSQVHQSQLQHATHFKVCQFEQI